MTTALQDGRLDEALAAWASRCLGFDRRALRFERLRAVAAAEALRRGWPGLYAALEAGDEGLDAALTAAATVGETYFFRQREHFDLLKDLRLPPQPQPVLAWSAGCSTGEEAYSLAAALHETAGLGPERLQVWGTDVNPASLEAARRADYGRWSFRAAAQEAPGAGDAALEEALRSRVLDPQVKACVRFAEHNLLEAPKFDGGSGPRFHLAFCRNVLVYFGQEAADRAAGELVKALVPGGWLVLGNMDLASPPQGLRRVGPPSLCVYEKPRPGEAAAPPPRPALAPPKAPRGPAQGLKAFAARVHGGLSARRQPSPPRPAPAERAEPEALDPVDWHRAVLALHEQGQIEMADLELPALLEAHPDYLPGWFEHALAQRRLGRRQLAAASLHKVLDLAQGRAASDLVEGPEPLSLDFYVSGAHAFLQSLGEEP